jgi:hypothetical protein
MMFKDVPSTPDTFSRKRFPNKPPTLCTASSVPLNHCDCPVKAECSTSIARTRKSEKKVSGAGIELFSDQDLVEEPATRISTLRIYRLVDAALPDLALPSEATRWKESGNAA